MITFEAKALAPAIALLGRFAGGRAGTSLHALACVRVEAHDGKATLVASDLDGQVETTIDATGEGAALVDYKQLKHISGIAADEITIKETPKQVVVSAGRYRVSAGKLDPDDFPVMARPDCELAEVPGLAGAIKRVAFAAGVTDVRYYLNGVTFLPDAVFATNGECGAILDMAVPVKASAILGNNAVEAVIQLGANTVGFSDAAAIFRHGDTTIITKIIDGKPADLRRAIPATATKHVELDREEFLFAIAAITPGLDKYPAVHFTAKSGTLLLESIDKKTGATAEAEMPCVGDDIDIYFKHYLLVNSAKHVDAKTVKLGFSGTDGAYSGTVIRDGSWSYVMMPTRA